MYNRQHVFGTEIFQLDQDLFADHVQQNFEI